MADPRFYRAAGPFSLSHLAEIGGAELIRGNAEATCSGVSSLEEAGAEHVSFLDEKRHLRSLTETRAGACLLREEMAEHAPPDIALLVTPEPYRAYAKISQAFHPLPAPEPGVHASAVVADDAVIGPGSRVGPGAVIEGGAELGAACDIGANVWIGPGVVVGDGCRIGASASLMCCLVGRGVIIHAGARIGQDGFGFAPGLEGHERIAQVGRVIIEDGVEIGANSAIDRGTLGDTVIGAGTKIDNLVQIGHNVRLGKGCILVGQVGVSGSTTVGNLVMMGGQAGIAGHLHIGDGARVAAKAGVMRDIPPKQDVFGIPAMPGRQFMRQVAMIARLAKKKGP